MVNKEIFEELYQKALEGYNNAYAPYSNFKVGSSVLLKNGDIINGCNVENASYGLSNCAERTALFKVYSLGYRQTDIVAMLILGNTDDPISPCGACRQVMFELLSKSTPIYLTNLKNDLKVTSVEELLPYAFREENLHE